MATRTEREHTEQQRRGPKPKAIKRNRARKRRSEKLGSLHETARTAKKASYALESPSKAGKHSRKSTRASANRSKPDTNLNLREGRQKGSPKSRFRKARARSTRVRGRSAPRD